MTRRGAGAGEAALSPLWSWQGISELSQLASAALSADIWPLPPLAGIRDAAFDPAARSVLEEGSAELAQRLLHGRPPEIWPGLQASEGFVRLALRETAFGTALALQSLDQGNLDVAENSARVAIARLGRFGAGPGSLRPLRVYLLHAAWADYRALHYYGEVPEEEFLLGVRHRPYGDFLLREDLRFEMARDHVGRRLRAGERVLYLRSEGLAALRQIGRVLRESGVLARGREMRVGSHLDLFGGAPARETPEEALAELRQEIVSSLPEAAQGLRVLELGCSVGVLRAAIRQGRLQGAETYSADLSRGRLLQLQYATQGRVRALRAAPDRLPFAARSVDIVVGGIGAGAWALGDRSAAIALEMRRILREGGRLGLIASWPDPCDLPQELQATLRQLPRQAGQLGEALRSSGLCVERTERRTVASDLRSTRALQSALARAGAFAVLEEELPFAEAERLRERFARACKAAQEGQDGRLVLRYGVELVTAGA